LKSRLFVASVLLVFVLPLSVAPASAEEVTHYVFSLMPNTSYQCYQDSVSVFAGEMSSQAGVLSFRSDGGPGALFRLSPVEGPPLADTTAPGMISDLRVISVDPSEVALAWTASGDDGDRGTATKYRLREAEQTITPRDWPYDRLIEGLPAPAAAGTSESFTITGLTPGVHYLAVRALDEESNRSPISNVVEVTVPRQPPPDGPGTTDLTGTWDGKTVALSWAAAGGADYEIRRKEADDPSASLLTTTGDSTWTDATALPFTCYTYEVRTVDTQGAESGALRRVRVRTYPNGDASAPAPESLKAELLSADLGSVRISWSPATPVQADGLRVFREAAPAGAGKAAIAAGREDRGTWTGVDASVRNSGNGLVAEESPAPPPGRYSYWMHTSDGKWIGPLEVDVPALRDGLIGVFPNPSNGRFRVSYALKTEKRVELSVYDASGRLAAPVLYNTGVTGQNEWSLDLRDVSSRPLAAGVYFLSLNLGSRMERTRVVLFERR
jgi:hypothetical protein